MGLIKISHFREKCIGCGVCAETAGQTWYMNDIDGKSSLYEGENKRDLVRGSITDVDLDDNLRAAEKCPVKIIQVHC